MCLFAVLTVGIPAMFWQPHSPPLGALIGLAPLPYLSQWPADNAESPPKGYNEMRKSRRRLEKRKNPYKIESGLVRIGQPEIKQFEETECTHKSSLMRFVLSFLWSQSLGIYQLCAQ